MDDNQRMWEDRYASGGSSPDGAQPHPEVAALLDRTARERTGGPPTALDLGAGTGRHTLALAAAGYDPRADLENTPDSVFCSHGAGRPVAWNEVRQYMHLPSVLKPEKPAADSARKPGSAAPVPDAIASADEENS